MLRPYFIITKFATFIDFLQSIEGKGEKGLPAFSVTPAFSPFLTLFSTLPKKNYTVLIAKLKISSANAFDLDMAKTWSSGEELTVNNILDSSTLEQYADDKLIVAQRMRLCL